MEDILASIRRILSEDEVAATDPTPHINMPQPAPAHAGFEDDALDLDPAMMVRSPAPQPAPHRPDSTTEFTAMNEPHIETAPDPQERESAPMVHQAIHQEGYQERHQDGLVAPETANAAASSVSGLVRTLAAERNTVVHRGGPTIEEMMREEMRPLIKGWLDAHLPPLVERLVRAEIDRVVTRAAL